ncbi:PilZ domain-containing protein [Planctomycetota bacterium]
MYDEAEGEHREFVRIRVEIPVRYKFVTKLEDNVTATERIFEGFTRNISAGGFLLVGRIPNTDYLAKLLTEQIVIGVNMNLPSYGVIKALVRVAWVEAFKEDSKTIRMGCMFKEVNRDAADEIFKFVIRQQMP